MSEQTTMIFRIDADLKRAFEEAAKARDRNASQLLRDYVRVVVDEHMRRTAQQSLKLEPTMPKHPPATAKPKKGQKLAAAKPANWKPQ